MCFSPAASFITGTVLTTLGVATWRITRKKERLIAVVPVIFAAQQLIEGGQWLFLQSSGPSLLLAYLFLFFAFLFWPVYVPLAVYILDQKRRKTLIYFLIMGIVTSLLLFWDLLNNQLSATIYNKCIYYQIHISLKPLVVLLYFGAACGSLLISKLRAVRDFGILVLFSAAMAANFYLKNFVSVWCFFAAGLSSLIYWYFRRQKRR